MASDLPNLGSLRTMHGTPISFSCSRARPVSLGKLEWGGRRQGPGRWGLQYTCDTPPLLHTPPRQGALTVGEDDARIVQRHLPFEGGLAYGIDQLLEPPGLGARCDRFETRPLWLVREATGQRRRGVSRPLALSCPPSRLAMLPSFPHRKFAAFVG